MKSLDVDRLKAPHEAVICQKMTKDSTRRKKDRQIDLKVCEIHVDCINSTMHALNKVTQAYWIKSRKLSNIVDVFDKESQRYHVKLRQKLQ